MGFFKKFAQLFGPAAPSTDERTMWVYARCKRCHEKLRLRVDLMNDLSVEYGADGAATGYFCRKMLMGEQRCYQQMEIELTFDAKRQLCDQKISGGELITEAEYYSV
jgi:hypothetical protein